MTRKEFIQILCSFHSLDSVAQTLVLDAMKSDQNNTRSVCATYYQMHPEHHEKVEQFLESVKMDCSDLAAAAAASTGLKNLKNYKNYGTPGSDPEVMCW